MRHASRVIDFFGLTVGLSLRRKLITSPSGQRSTLIKLPVPQALRTKPTITRIRDSKRYCDKLATKKETSPFQLQPLAKSSSAEGRSRSVYSTISMPSDAARTLG